MLQLHTHTEPTTQKYVELLIRPKISLVAAPFKIFLDPLVRKPKYAKADFSFEHVKYSNLICIMYNFPGSYQYSFPQNIITTQTLQTTFMLKISR